MTPGQALAQTEGTRAIVFTKPARPRRPGTLCRRSCGKMFFALLPVVAPDVFIEAGGAMTGRSARRARRLLPNALRCRL